MTAPVPGVSAIAPTWDSIPAYLAERKQWLVWKLESKPGQTKPAKIPYYAKGTRRVGEQGSDKDRGRLVTLAQAREAFERGNYAGVGLALLPGDGLVGIDLDHVVTPTTGEMTKQAMGIVLACASYTEYSPSGTGLHIIVQGVTTTNKSNDIGVEVFCGRQYFTVTGRRVADTPGDVAPVDQAVFKRLHVLINRAKDKRKGEPAAVRLQADHKTDDFKRVNEAALRMLSAWVPELLPAATSKGDGYRITSRALNRPNQEDLSITPGGIVDFGLEGTGDPTDGRRTAIDVVMEWLPASKPKDALLWLAKRLGLDLSPPKRKTVATGAGSASYERFSCDDSGLFYRPPDDAPKRICDPLRVTALARDQYGNGAALQLEFGDVFGQQRRHLLPMERLGGDGAQMRAELLAMGFPTPTDMNRRRWLVEYLLSCRPEARIRYVPKLGWAGNCFVLPAETLGQPDDEAIVFCSEAPIEGGLSQRGTLHAWQRDIARLAIGNSRLILCIAMAFAAPLLRWAYGMGGGGVNLIGSSSLGKTTGLQAAASVYGLGAEGQPNSYIQKARASSNGLEYQAEHFNDLLLVLDEMIHLEASDAGAAMYTLADGVGKNRARAAGGLRHKPTWRLLFLTSSEISLAQHIATANKVARGGLDVRLIGVPAEAASKSMFESHHDFEGGAHMAGWIKEHVAKSYGVAGRMWLEYLVAHADKLASDLQQRMVELESQIVPEFAAGQVRRGGSRFCLIAAAGEMAAHLTGWPNGVATWGARVCFEAWIATREGGLGASEDAAMVAQVRQFIAEHGQLRLPDIGRDEKEDDRAPRTGMRCGWSKVSERDTGDGVKVRDYFFFIDAFRNIVCKGLNYKSVLALLRDRKLLQTGPNDRFDRREWHPLEGHATVYRIHSTILDQAEDA